MIGYWGHYENIIKTKIIKDISYFVFEEKKCPEKLMKFVVDNNKKYFIINSQSEMLKIIKENDIPEITLVGSFGIIFTEEMINSLNNQIINVHPGILPDYRGRHPLPQAIVNRERFMGISSHFLTKSIDEGRIIDMKITNIDYSNSYMDNINELYSFLPDLIDNTIDKYLKKDFPIMSNFNIKSKYYKPLSKEKIREIIDAQKLIDLFGSKEDFNE